MKANRRFVNGDDAVSPVIAVILMVAITVVLAATVYLWVSGFGSNQNNLVQASFGTKAVDYPNGDTDSSDDVLQVTYVSGPEDLQATDISISIDGALLQHDGATTTSGEFYPGGTQVADGFCTTNPGGDADMLWERGGSIYLLLTQGSPACDAGGLDAATEVGAMDGIHQVTISVKGQVVLDTSVEVHDNACDATC